MRFSIKKPAVAVVLVLLAVVYYVYLRPEPAFKSASDAATAVGGDAEGLRVPTDNALSAIANEIAETIVTSSVWCAGMVEDQYYLDKRQMLDHEAFRSIVAEFGFLLIHLSDRHALQVLGPPRRATFMDILAAKISELGTKWPMSSGHPLPAFESRINDQITVVGLNLPLLNKRQVEYANYDKVLPDSGERLQGTLFWEFGKHVAEVIEKPGSASPYRMFAAALGAETYIKVIPLLGKVKEP